MGGLCRSCYVRCSSLVNQILMFLRMFRGCSRVSHDVQCAFQTGPGAGRRGSLAKSQSSSSGGRNEVHVENEAELVELLVGMFPGDVLMLVIGIQ